MKELGSANQKSVEGRGGEQKRGVFEKAAYRKLVLWKNLYELRKMVYDITKEFPSIEIRRVSQMRDAARSAKQNVQEGHRSKSRAQFLRFLDIAHSSLHELAGDVEDSYDDGLLSEVRFEELCSLINRTDYLFVRTISSLKAPTTEPKPSRSSQLLTATAP